MRAVSESSREEADQDEAVKGLPCAMVTAGLGWATLRVAVVN